MVRPRLIHPVPVKYRVLERTEGFHDDEDRAPIRVAQRKVFVILNAQIKWTTDSEQVTTPSGVAVQAIGYILCETKELDEKSVDPKFGDQITEISSKAQEDLFVLSTKPRAHYPDIGGPGFLQIDFYRRRKAA